MAKLNPKYSNKTEKYGANVTFEKYLNAGIITKKDVELINAYIARKQATGKKLSPARIQNIKIILAYWQKYIKTPYTEVTADTIINAIGEFKQGKTESGAAYSQNSIHTYITILKGFLCHLCDRKIVTIEKRDLEEIKTPGMDKHTTDPIDILTADELLQLIKATANPLHRALIAVSWETGARPEEINALQWSDAVADEYGYKVYITDFKTNGRRVARLTFAAPYLSQWRDMTTHDKNEDYIFVNRWGEPFTYTGMLNLVYRLTKKAGIQKSITLYSFRKGRINDMVKTNVPQAAIKAQIWNNQGSQMLDVYLSLNDQMIDDMMLSHAGIKKDNATVATPLTSITCPECHAINEADAKFCKKCGHALTEKAAEVKATVEATPEYQAVEADKNAVVMKKIQELEAMIQAIKSQV